LKMFFIVQFNATAVPPVSLTIPLGAPVVPEVSITLIKLKTYRECKGDE